MTTFDDSPEDITKAIEAEALRRSNKRKRFTISTGGVDFTIPLVGLMVDYCAACDQQSSACVVDCDCACHRNWGRLNAETEQ